MKGYRDHDLRLVGEQERQERREGRGEGGRQVRAVVELEPPEGVGDRAAVRERREAVRMERGGPDKALRARRTERGALVKHAIARRASQRGDQRRDHSRHDI